MSRFIVIETGVWEIPDARDARHVERLFKREPPTTLAAETHGNRRTPCSSNPTRRIGRRSDRSRLR